MIFDSDAFDLEVRAERLGAATFDKYDLARLLRITPTGVRQAVLRGSIEPPDFGTRWGAVQVVRILDARALDARQKPRVRLGTRQVSPCGTYAAYERHRRNGEPVDLLCRLAVRHKNREQKARQRERMSA